MIFAVRHRSASGRLDEMWEYDPARRVICLIFRLGSSEPNEILLPVCSPESPRFGAWAVTRADGESWKLHALRFWPSNGRGGDGPLMPSIAPLHQMLAHDTIHLTNAPEIVSEELATL